MIKLSEYQAAISATNHTTALDPSKIEITGGYVCDMLSDVMGSAQSGQVWITIMKHLNTIAVASMTGVPVIVFAKGNTPDPAVIEKAEAEEICLLSSALDTFSLAGILFGMLNK